MPTYEYRCNSCGHQFEKFTTKISNESNIDCPKCEGLAERLISGGAGFLFKGSGFHATDYRSDSYKKAEKRDSGTSGESKAKKDESSGKKPESKKPESKKQDSK